MTVRDVMMAAGRAILDDMDLSYSGTEMEDSEPTIEGLLETVEVTSEVGYYER